MLYLIGWSPCSGKSTVSSYLAKQYGLLHIKLDDLVDELAQKAAQDQVPICLARKGRTSDQIWLRQPEEMAVEEWHFYEEIFPYLFDNWMKRDILFAQKVREEAEVLGYPCLMIDGSLREDQLSQQVAQLLTLADKAKT